MIEGNCLSLKGQAKFLLRRQKLYQITNIFFNPPWSLSILHFENNLLVLRGTFRMQCIYRTKLIIQIAYIYYRLPCTYVTSFLAYSGGELRIKRWIYRTKDCWDIFNTLVRKFLTFRMMVNLSRTFHETRSFFLVSSQK